MTDTKRLRERLDQSGLTRTFIAESLGVTESNLEKKITNELEFDSEEIYRLEKLLKLGSIQCDELFFKPKEGKAIKNERLTIRCTELFKQEIELFRVIYKVKTITEVLDIAVEALKATEEHKRLKEQFNKTMNG
jgi:transcriptional regulator with XRE-family HTH domain